MDSKKYNDKIYLAAPIVKIPEDWKEKIANVKKAFVKSDHNFYVYDPVDHGVPNAWGMSMEEWSKCIFALDVVAIDDCDWVVVCDFGRQMTSGTSWEAGYAFGKGKKILIIRMNEEDTTDYSVMMNGCSANAMSYSDFMNIVGSRNIDTTTCKITKPDFYDCILYERGRKPHGVVFN